MRRRASLGERIAVIRATAFLWFRTARAQKICKSQFFSCSRAPTGGDRRYPFASRPASSSKYMVEGVLVAGLSMGPLRRPFLSSRAPI